MEWHTGNVKCHWDKLSSVKERKWRLDYSVLHIINGLNYIWMAHIAWAPLLGLLFWYHDDVIKWKHFSCYWSFVRGIHRSPVNSPHKGQWRGALMFTLICYWINGWVNNREAGDLRRYRAHYDVTVMVYKILHTIHSVTFRKLCIIWNRRYLTWAIMLHSCPSK